MAQLAPWLTNSPNFSPGGPKWIPKMMRKARNAISCPCLAPTKKTAPTKFGWLVFRPEKDANPNLVWCPWIFHWIMRGIATVFGGVTVICMLLTIIRTPDWLAIKATHDWLSWQLRSFKSGFSPNKMELWSQFLQIILGCRWHSSSIFPTTWELASFVALHLLHSIVDNPRFLTQSPMRSHRFITRFRVKQTPRRSCTWFVMHNWRLPKKSGARIT